MVVRVRGTDNGKNSRSRRQVPYCWLIIIIIFFSFALLDRADHRYKYCVLRELSATRSGTTFWECPPPPHKTEGPRHQNASFPRQRETAPVHGGHRSADGCGINTQHIRRATNNKNSRQRNVRFVCGWKINKRI